MSLLALGCAYLRNIHDPADGEQQTEQVFRAIYHAIHHTGDVDMLSAFIALDAAWEYPPPFAKLAYERLLALGDRRAETLRGYLLHLGLYWEDYDSLSVPFLARLNLLIEANAATAQVVELGDAIWMQASAMQPAWRMRERASYFL